MKAIVMAGGEGVRLRPMTCRLCKPMVPMFGKPLMEYAVELLENNGIEGIAATLQYRPQPVLSYFGERLEYFLEDQPLGTAGSVLQAAKFLGEETFIVLSGDALTDLNIRDALEFHKSKNALATLVLTHAPDVTEYGLVVLNEEGKIERFVEKPGWGDVCGDLVNTGIYILEPEVLSRIPESGPYDFGRELFPQMVREGLPVYGYTMDSYWCDIGSCDRYLQSVCDALEGKIHLFAEGKDGITIHPDAMVEPGAKLIAPCWIGADAFVAAGATVGPMAVLERGACVERGAVVTHSVLLAGSEIGPYSRCDGSILCQGSYLGRGATAEPGSVLGESSQAGDESLLQAARVWPFKRVQGGSTATGTLLYGQNGGTTVTRHGLRGGRETLPVEDCVRLGLSLATLTRRCAVCHDGSGAARMASESCLSGLCAGGAKVYRLGAVTPQTMRASMRELNAAFGLFCRCEGEELLIELNEGALPHLSEKARRSLASAMQRGDAVRVPASLIRPPIDVLHAGNVRVRQKEAEFSIAPTGRRLCVLSDSRVILREAKALLQEAVELSETPEHTLSVRVSGDGRKALWFDEDGSALEERLWPQLAAQIAHMRQPGEPIYAHAEAPAALKTLAEQWNVPIMYAAAGDCALEELLAGDEAGKPLWRLLYFDAMAQILLLMEYLGVTGQSLASAAKTLRREGWSEQILKCPDGMKAAYMNRILARTKNLNRCLDHGVRVRHAGGWVMLSPSEDRPEFHILCQGDTQEFADELGVFYLDLVGKENKEE